MEKNNWKTKIISMSDDLEDIMYVEDGDKLLQR
jgi:hypothetical protein